MGKIKVGLLLLLLLGGCVPEYEDSFLCPPVFIGSADFVFVQTGPDTISLGDTLRFRASGLNPVIEELVTTERLPYAPKALLYIEAVSDTIPPWTTQFEPDYFYPAVRPFRVLTKPGYSVYSENSIVELHGELSSDSLHYDFQLRALQAGLYRIRWDNRLPEKYYTDINTVILDAKKRQCNYFWRMMPYFEANQQLDSIKAAFPFINLTERPIYRFIYVRGS
jgi:hypothetical protein